MTTTESLEEELRLLNVRIYKKEEIEISDEIGSGGFGVVFSGRLKNTNKRVAIKQQITRQSTDPLKEITHLRHLAHPNIVAMYGVCINPCSLIMEYLDGSNLWDVIYNSEKYYTINLAISWMLQCAKGLDYMHAKIPLPIIHRDIKSPNLVLNEKGDVLKIVDFGSATHYRETMTNNIGTSVWMAPEVYFPAKYTEKCDVYSFAIIIWEIFYKEVPFKDKTSMGVQQAVCRGQRPLLTGHSPTFVEKLIIACWAPKPEERLAINTVVRLISSASALYKNDNPFLSSTRQPNIKYVEKVQIESPETSERLLERIPEHRLPLLPDNINEESLSTYVEHLELLLQSL